MVFSLIITLILALVIIAITVNVVQQHKEKIQKLKRAEFTKLRHALEETEEILFNSTNVPMSNGISLMLMRRVSYLLKAMKQLEPEQRELRQRLEDTENRIEELKNNTGAVADNISLPDDDQQCIAMFKAIKKLRTMLRAEHARGKVETQMVVDEDARLDLFQLRITVETQIKRGKSALTNNMIGSSRQYYEKALKLLSASNQQNDYISQRQAEVQQQLAEITAALKSGNAKDAADRNDKDNKDLDELFAPKKKW
ncbi:MAG: hypothetical protein NWQ30_09240 [Alishewanella sp.]|nr:hypothetical protein [Alishewanella sp.]